MTKHRISPSQLGEGAQRQIANAVMAEHIRDELAAERGRRDKYRAEPCVMDGIRFASKTERDRYAELLIEQRAGRISDLEPHPKFPLTINGRDCGTYTADSRYVRNGVAVVEEVKSAGTKRDREYRLRRKVAEAAHNMQITEIVR